MPSLLLIVVGVVVSVVIGGSIGACFEPDDPPPPPPTPSGTITGRILVDQSTGQAAFGDLGAAQDALGIAIAVATGDADNVPSVGGAAGDTSALSTMTPRRRHDAPPPSNPFRAGDAIAHFERGAFDRVSIVRELSTMRDRVDEPAARALLSKVTFTVGLCAPLFCSLKLTDGDGFLDENATAIVIDALHKVARKPLKQVMRNEVYQGFRVPNDTEFNRQWNMQQMNLPAAWDLSIGSPDVVIAVLDSGVVTSNPDLRDRLTKDPNNASRIIGADFVDVGTSLDGDGPDLDPEDPGDNLRGSDEGQDSFHGTHTSGIIGASTDNRRGVAGVTWQGEILPVRVLGEFLSGNLSDILFGLVWAVGDVIDNFPRNQKPAQVVNMSLGGFANSQSLQLWNDVVTAILDDPNRRFGSPVLVAAVGNSAIDASQILPAGIQRVLSVGASRFDGQRASYSNFGPVLDVLAPGGQIGLDQNNDGIDDLILSTLGVDLALEQGTSMAAPHVAGLAALIVSQKPELTHDQVHNLIRDTANIAFQCNEGCGRGIVDAAAALLAANVQVVPEPRLSLSAQTVAFNGGINQGTIRVQNLGALPAPFTVTIERGQASLFSVTPTSGTVAAAGGSITLNLTLNRGSATVGSTTLVVRGTGAADGQQLTAELNFNDSPSRGVRSLDAVEVGAYQRTDDGNLVRRGEAIALRANNFAYEIKGLTPGDYELFAVGDDNFDGTFDSQRESIGAFPITTEPQAVTIENVGDTVPDINFGVALRAVNRDKDVGSPCTEANKQQTCSRILDTAPDVGCIEGFPGGYCSRFCDDNICGPNGRCDELECAGAPCKVCLQRCVSDSQCRDGYICVLDTCVPPGFDDGF